MVAGPLAALLLGLWAQPARSQAVPTGLPTREEIDPARRQATPPPARLSVDGDIERSPCALDDPAYAAIRVTIGQASFNNLAPVSAEDVAPVWQRYAGADKPIAVVCEIRDAVATYLRARGYIAAVQVPAQRIENGEVRFEVIYARLTAVRVRGDAGRDERLVQKTLEHIATGTAFNRREAERYLLLARDIPGLDVRLSLRPAGTAPGDVIGEVSVRRTAYAVDFNLQDYAPAATGRWGGQLRGEVYGLTGLGDRTSLSGYSTLDFDEQQVVQFGHDFAVGSQGLRLAGHFTYAWTHPDLGASVTNLRARSLIANLEASYPFVRRQDLTLRGTAGFDYVNQEVTFQGQDLSADRLRVVYARLDADASDLKGVGPGGTSGWRLAGTAELRQGLDIFDASPNCLADVAACVAGVPPSLVDGDPVATVLRLTGLAEWRLAKNLTLALLPRGQFSSSALLAFEQFSGGSYTVGRGYDPGIIAGDTGAGFATELRYDRLGLLGRNEIGVQPYAFLDTLWVWNRNSPAGRDPEQLASIGAGARVGWSDRARLDLTLAVPLRHAGPPGIGTDAGDVRVLVSLTTRLLPWR